MEIKSAKDLMVYKKAYDLAMQIFRISKAFPKAERFSLTDQIRRSSRSVCLNLREVWAKRRYKAHFISKLTDCDAENDETSTSLDFALDCEYISKELHKETIDKYTEIQKMLKSMLFSPDKFLLHYSSIEEPEGMYES